VNAVAARRVIPAPRNEHVRRRAPGRFRNRLNTARPGGNGQPIHASEFSRGAVGSRPDPAHANQR